MKFLLPQCEEILGGANGLHPPSRCAVKNYRAHRALTLERLSGSESLLVIILDTNVISETLCLRPSATVLQWVESRSDQCAVTAVTVSELLTGVRLLPSGKRRRGLMKAIERVLLPWAACLPYDEEAARAHAALREHAHTQGRNLSVENGMIAAICAVHGAILATHNVDDFDFLPVPTMNPWEKMA